MCTKIYKVRGLIDYELGKNGEVVQIQHRQKMSFCPSEEFKVGNTHFTILNSDVTKTNDYSLVIVTSTSEDECDSRILGQISDGYFENSRVGCCEKIDIKHD